MTFLLVTADRSDYGIEALSFDIALKHCKPGWYVIDLDLCEVFPPKYIDYHWECIQGMKRIGADTAKYEQEFCRRFRINA